MLWINKYTHKKIKRAEIFYKDQANLNSAIMVTIMGTSGLTRLSVRLLLIIFIQQASASPGHDCREEDSKYYLEEKLSRDISYVQHGLSSSCTVKFRDQSR
jgi:hypothetical protein